MKTPFSPAAKFYLSLMAITGWFALVGQFYLIIISRQASVPETIVRYFTFFTILTNILIAVGCTVLLLKPSSRWGRFFAKNTTLTATTVNILIVGATYNIILRWLWKPQGLQYVVDELLHLIIPLLFILFWLVFVPKGGLKWSNIFLWTVYPIAYLIIILIRGEFSGYYPYPFVDVTKLGYPQTLINSGGIAVAFIAVALLFVGIDKLMRRKAA
jgi:hypothetical protein